MNYGSKLSAILFRIFNSPLRKYFFEAKEKSGLDFSELLKVLYKKIKSTDDFKDTKLITKEYVDDDYWNHDIYKEVTTEPLIKLLQNSNF